MKRELLKKYVSKINLDLNKNQIDKFLIYENILVEWNKHMNLTGITESEKIYDKHFTDSLTCILSDKITKNSKVIDVGTGAGFPGLPLKIYDETIELTLLDSLNKRINFLKEVSKKIELKDIEFLHGRAEDYGQDENYREKFDIVVSRAVADLPILLEYCIPFIKVGGYFISHKGKKCFEEIENSKSALKSLNVEVEEIKRVVTSDDTVDHYIIIMKKIGLTDKKYPRKAGKPTKKPL